MSAVPVYKLSLEEYLELDKNSEERYEYFDGEVFAMSGASLKHNQVISNLTGELRNHLKDRDCQILPADMRLKVPAAFPYRYPDLVVVCGEPIIEELQGLELLVNPLVIIEVLSPSTEAYDHGRKFSAYQSIESFREYLLVAQDRPHVVQYVRQSDDKWLRSEVGGLEGEMTLETIKCTLSLGDIYRRVKLLPEGTV
ncbi:MAG: Uma2 family endonuclease [Acidobacteriota bacterium]